MYLFILPFNMAVEGIVVVDTVVVELGIAVVGIENILVVGHIHIAVEGDTVAVEDIVVEVGIVAVEQDNFVAVVELDNFVVELDMAG
jgi:hypothetical protein